mmetsp:Transcript_922/g.2104  ORF Transcript_922/g.2104 Transcript_922/m.2104 type:complete len:222 (-) Transcript_922:29-694(-)
MLLPQAPLGDLVALLVSSRRLVPLVHVVPLHGHVVVRDSKHRVLILRDRLRCRANAVADQVQGAQGMLNRLIVPVQLRQDSADVQMCARNGDVIGLQRDLDLQRLAQVAEGSMQLPHLFVVAAKVVAGYRQQVRRLVLALLSDEDGLGILELLEGLLVLPPPEEVHPFLVTTQDQLLEVLLIRPSIQPHVGRHRGTIVMAGRHRRSHLSDCSGGVAMTPAS